MKIQWNKVTWYSWALTAVIFLIIIPFLTFYFYNQYKEIVYMNDSNGAMFSSPVTAASSTIVYVNNEYGFSVTLPVSWKGYTIVITTWTGYVAPIEHGPIVSIRNPRWTSSTPTQDIPIMVFTPAQWSAVNSGTMSVSAAPIGPDELGKNARYVFALPARYNYAYPEGWQEVQSIIESNPLHGISP